MRRLFIFVIFAFIASSAFSQTIIPVNQSVLQVKLPRAKEFVLRNGLHVLILEQHEIPTFIMEMVILNGGTSDPKNTYGVASFTASLLDKGTSTRSSRDIAKQLETLGSTLSCSADLSSSTSTMRVEGLSENFSKVLEVFSDVILHPSFPQKELEQYKSLLIANLSEERADPDFLAEEQFAKSIYGNEHPGGRVEPTPATVKAITTSDLRHFHQSYYVTNHAFLVVIGDVHSRPLLQQINAAFGQWLSRKVHKPMIDEAIPPASPFTIHLVNRPNSVQTSLILGNLAIKRTDPDYFSLLVMNQILGGSPSSRLFLELREHKGYTYGAYSTFNIFTANYAGTWYAHSDVRSQVTDGALHDFLQEFNRIHNEKVPLSELKNAQHSIVGKFALSLESPNKLLQNLVTQKIYHFPADYWDNYPKEVNQITPEQVQEAALKYIDLPHLQVIAVGDAASIKDSLTKYGPVKTYNAEGELLQNAP